MKSLKLPLLVIIALILLTLSFSLTGQGQFLLPQLKQSLEDLKRDLPKYNINIRMSEAMVNAIIDEMDGVPTPPGGGRSPNERVHDLKVGIKGELTQAKTNQIALKVAIQQFGAALDRSQKDPTPENLQDVQGIADQITKLRNSLNGNFEVIKNMIRLIMMIRQDSDDKEWNNPNGKYKDERQTLDNWGNMLAGRPPVPDVVGMQANEACGLIMDVGLVPEIIALTEKPPEGKDYTVKSQYPAKNIALHPGDAVKIEVYGKVVPNVVGMFLQRAVEVMAQAGVTVDSVVLEPALSKEVSDKVYRQEPLPGEPLSARKTSKLWHYGRFSKVPSTPTPATPLHGFQKGDAGRIDPRFASHEKLLENGRAIAGGHPGQGFPWQRHWAIKEFSTPEEARANLKKYANDLTKDKTGKWKYSYGEGDHRVHIAEDGVASYWTSLGYVKNEGSSYIYIRKIYRDKFIIFYNESTKTYNDNLKKTWPLIYEKSIKLIDLRFPQK
jgi:hypothetical protein